jgi:CheY-like chemotaxis protein
MNTLRRILLVEDNPDDVELTLTAREDHNVANQVDVARDSAEGLEDLDCRGAFACRDPVNPVVILPDLKLPEMDGLEVLQVRKNASTLLPILAVMPASYREERDLVKRHDRGVNAYVVKPTVFLECVDAVRELGRFWAAVNEPPPPVQAGRKDLD